MGWGLPEERCNSAPLSHSFTAAHRWAIVLLLLGIPIALGLLAGTRATVTHHALLAFGGAAVFTTLRAFTGLVVAYGLARKLRALSRRSR